MLTYNDWYKWKWKLGKDKPLNCFDQWQFNPDTSSIKDMSFKESVKDALVKIHNLGKPIVLFYSGGLDSEIILKEALESNIPVIPVSIRFKNGLNGHDMYYVDKFSKEHNIDIHYLDIDFEEWFTDNTTEYGYLTQIQTYSFIHVATPLNFWARKEIENQIGECVTITGTGDLPLAKIYDKHNCFNWNWNIAVAIDSQYKKLQWYKEHYPDDIPLFFVYTGELVKSFLKSEEIIKCVQDDSYKVNVVTSKQQMFFKHWPDLEKRTKYTGFENVNISMEMRDVFNDTSNNILDLYSNIPYDTYIKFFGM